MIERETLAWVIAGYVAFFWIFLFARILLMRGQEIDVLTIAPKDRLKNVLGTVAFLGLLLVWSGLFVYLAFHPGRHTLLRSWWTAPSQAAQAIEIAGLVAAIACQVLMWVAILQMGTSWRIGIDDVKPGELVSSGVFGLSRNPIFVGFDGIGISAFLIQPNTVFLVFAVLLVIGVHVQILGEEKHLAATYGEAYEEYRAKVPRYFWFL